MNARIFNNATSMTLQATLYIQAGADLGSLYGTLNVSLRPGETKTVHYGDLRNNYLLGLRISPLPESPLDTYYCLVRQRGDALDQWLNQADVVDITVERLQKLERYGPIEQTLNAQ